MTALQRRAWVPDLCEDYVQPYQGGVGSQDGGHRPANRSPCSGKPRNPRAEAILSAGLGSRPSLGYPGDKYKMGLEAIEEIEVIAAELCAEGVPVFAKTRGFTRSHKFAIEVARYGGGQTASKKLRKAGFLACGIGLPAEPVQGDMNGLRIGTPELVRFGVGEKDARTLASLIARAMNADEPEDLAAEVADLRATFDRLHFVRSAA